MAKRGWEKVRFFSCFNDSPVKISLQSLKDNDDYDDFSKKVITNIKNEDEGDDDNREDKEEEEEEHAKDKDVVWYISAWVTRPERPKGAKDEVKGARRPPTRSWGPTVPLTSIPYI